MLKHVFQYCYSLFDICLKWKADLEILENEKSAFYRVF